MKKLIALLLWATLFLPSSVFAYTMCTAGAGGNAVDMSRGFEVNSDPSGWAAKTDTGSLINLYDTAQPHTGTHSMSILGNATTAAYQQYDMGATRTPVSFAQWVYLPSSSTGDDTYWTACAGTSACSSPAIRWGFGKVSGAYKAKMAGVATYTGTVSLTANAYYRLEVSYIQSGAISLTVFNSSGTQVDAISGTAQNAVPTRYFINGRYAINVTTGWGTWHIDDVGLDYTTAVSPLWPFTVGN
jgi:hypothetical protein